jgi:hypothetical protein
MDMLVLNDEIAQLASLIQSVTPTVLSIVTLTCVLIFFSENKKKPVDVSGLMFLLKV